MSSHIGTDRGYHGATTLGDQPNYSLATSSFDVENISPDSSIHESDYTSDEDDVEYGGDSRFRSLNEIVKEQEQAVQQLANSDSSKSSSTGSPWGEGTGSSSYVSSQAAKSAGSTFAAARKQLQARQQKAVVQARHPNQEDRSKPAGADPWHPIDVTAPKTRHSNPKRNDSFVHRAMELEKLEIQKVQQQQIDSRTTKHEPLVTRVVGLFPTGNTLVTHHEARNGKKTRSGARNWNGRRSVPDIVFPELRTADDDLSTLADGHHYPSTFLRQMIQSENSHSNNVRKAIPATRREHTVQHRSCIMYRSDFELFLIIVIAASLMTLVVLLALILATR